MKNLGQHFLKNKSALKKIVDALELRPGDHVVEIGAGHGELTQEIFNFAYSAEAAAKAGQFSIFKKRDEKIIAIEKDEKLVELLRKKFAGNKNIEIISGDALKILPRLIESVNLKIENCKLKIVGNIPYYITGKLLRIVGESEHKPKLCVLALQKEVAERICAKPPRMTRLAASVQFWAEPKIMMRLSKNDFGPPPEVDSAIVKLKIVNCLPASLCEARRAGKLSATEGRGLAFGGKIAAEKYYKLVRRLFAQPRKTILNNLSHITYHVSREGIAEKLREIGIRPDGRPQDLSVSDIIKISEASIWVPAESDRR